MATSGSTPPEAPLPLSPEASPEVISEVSPEKPDLSGLVPVLEALLFASPQPLSAAAVREVLEHLSDEDVVDLVGQLRNSLEDAGRGVTVVEVAGGFQIVSRREYSSYVQKMLRGRRKARLSRAGLETLAIVAYRQPVTKADIESIRGVDSSGVLAHLLDRSLVGLRGRAKAVGRPLLYGTTQEFLVYFGLNELSELPRPEELAALLKDRELVGEREVAEDEDALSAGDLRETIPEPSLQGEFFDAETIPVSEEYAMDAGNAAGDSDGDPPR